MLDSYAELEAPWYIETLKELPYKCEVLNRDHLGAPGVGFEYFGLCNDIDSLAQKLQELGDNYEVVSIRRHCITGVVVKEVGKIFKIIGIGLRSKENKRIDYIDLIIDSVDSDKYMGELGIEEEFFEIIIDTIAPGEKFIKRRDSSPYWKQTITGNFEQ